MCINFPYLFIIPSFILIWIISLIIRLRKPKPLTLLFTEFAFFLYILVLIKIVFFPIVIQSKLSLTELIGEHNHFYYVNYHPFKTIILTLSSANWEKQILGNIVMFVPFSFFILLISQSGKLKYRKALFLSALSSFIIEATQLIINEASNFPNRVVDIDDIILNSAGALIGIAIFHFMQKSKIYNLVKKGANNN
ncbi:VanZ family protein [[Clostridium] polysaccharolyticum]|uniref:Glycopeptide antibiotics resistance protein n=1 Tax=[Clostridium] polysaccharolyticum TaxID=29364 RepID=A0A1I0ASH6_9FIRM|nr:VanZ family protein [[Clostridium] polysaccharolyticum]SES97338.1 Glycopeptide antibiotics resistance protein [[Clostridium] polysaccharolyticum]